MGTPAFAVATLRGLAGAGHAVAAAYTRPPAQGGRGLRRRLSPVHAAAADLGIPVLHPRTLRGEEAALAFREHRADVAIVVAYGLILPLAILEAPPLGCLNLHASLLPRWRGAAPMQRAVMAGDPEAGVAVMRMEEGLDTGPVAMEARIALTPGMTSGDLHDRLAPVGAGLMTRAVDALARGALDFEPQSAVGVTYAHKIDKAECRITWNAPAERVVRQIQGLSPSPGAFFEAEFAHGRERIKALRAECRDGAGPPGAVLDDALTVACGTGAVGLTLVQRPGRGPLVAVDFLRGARIDAGMRVD